MRNALIRWLRRRKGEQGQALILFVGLFTVILLAGALTVDFGIWFSERRGAQTDADLPALAGAQECAKALALGTPTPCDAGAPAASAAEAAALSWFNDNNRANAGNATPVTIAAGFASCVSVDSKRVTKALFTSLFGVGPNDIGAHARACAGASSGEGGDLPFEIADTSDPCFTGGHPNFTALCLLATGAGGCSAGSGSSGGLVERAPGGTPGRPPTRTPINTPTRTRTPTATPGVPATPTPSPTPSSGSCNPHQLLDLNAAPYCSQNGGPADIYQLILDGAPGTCRINTSGSCNPVNNGPWYDCVAVQTGVSSNRVYNGVHDRLLRQGSCDDNGDGVESFGETVNLVVNTGDPLTSLYEARVCPKLGFWDTGKVSPRIVTIIVLAANPPPGNAGHPIVGFAGFYLAGCWDDSGGATPTGVSDPGLNKNCTDTPHIPPGKLAIYGQFVKLIVQGGDIGPPDPNNSTLFGIHLTQ